MRHHIQMSITCIMIPFLFTGELVLDRVGCESATKAPTGWIFSFDFFPLYDLDFGKRKKENDYTNKVNLEK